MSARQRQQAGPNSNLVQVTNVGLSYTEARQLFMDLFAENFLRLHQESMSIAQARAEEITEKFLAAAFFEGRVDPRSMIDPGFQWALLSVQRDYARTGDTALGDVLVQMLVDRCLLPGRDLGLVVIDEAINTVSKLTAAQLSTLSLLFYVKEVRLVGLSFDDATAVVRQDLVATVEVLAPIALTDLDVRHLEYAGCLSMPETGTRLLGADYLHGYQTLFGRGVDVSAISDDLLPAFREMDGSGLFEVAVSSREELDTHLVSLGLGGQRSRIEPLMLTYRLSDENVDDFLAGEDGQLRAITESWKYHLGSVRLSSVGIAIGHSNLRRLERISSDLSDWIRTN